jgi:alcohol dehydrogenase (cytochrome c)
MQRRHWGSLLLAACLAPHLALAAGSDWSKPAGKDWPMGGGDWSNSRYSTLDKINTRTVAQLGGAWARKFEGETTRATPVVSDGLMFVTTTAAVYALKPDTGDIVWQAKPPAVMSGLYKGAAVGGGLVYVGLSTGQIVAYKEKTGEQAWVGSISDDPPLRGQFISAAPTYVDGLVIAGLANGDYGIIGRITALDARTGKQVWRFDTVPAPGQPGHETWPQDNDEWQRGGVGVWVTPAVDPKLGLVYAGTGNPVPQWGGEARAGDNLYSDSVLALDLKTGTLRWHYQLVHHDIWEQDAGTPVVLYDSAKTGKGLAVARADGYLFLLDRATGKPLVPVEERPVPQNARVKTAPTQPFPVTADQLGPRCMPTDMIPAGFKAACQYDPVDADQPNVMYPLIRTRQAPMAFSPATGLFYATAAVAPRWLIRYEDPRFFVATPSIPGMKSYGLFAAWDGKSKLAWQRRTPLRIENGSGMTATAGGLLFHGHPDGTFQALDARTGEQLWQFQTGANASGAPAVYEAGGAQYVAVTATNTLWSFKIGGTLPQAEAPPMPPTETSFAGRIEKTDRISLGAVIADTGLEKVRETFDEYAIRPMRARVAVGTKVTWTNNGMQTHSASALDGSWSTGPIAPGKTGTVTFDRPGTYTYICADHPFSLAQIIVE